MILAKDYKEMLLLIMTYMGKKNIDKMTFTRILQSKDCKEESAYLVKWDGETGISYTIDNLTKH